MIRGILHEKYHSTFGFIKEDSDVQFSAGDGYSGRYSYARRRDSRGRYSMNDYSYHNEMIHELKDMMNDAPDERTRQEFKRFIDKVENM